MSELFDSDFLNKIQQLVITSRVVLSDGAGGNRKSRSKGSSVEFSDYREYSMGDDFRRIDWNAYGRFEKLFVKLFMEEREAKVQILLDTSSSMDWGEPSKSVASRRLAAALSYISLSNYDRVSIACLSSRPEAVKPSFRGRNSFGGILKFLENIKYENPTDLYTAIRSLDIKSNSGISILISDLFTPGSLAEVIKYLQFRKQEVHICHLLAPQEVKPEISESLRLIDKETNSFCDVTASPLLLKTYKKVYEKFMADIEKSCFKYGANYMQLVSSTPIEQMIRMVVNRG